MSTEEHTLSQIMEKLDTIQDTFFKKVEEFKQSIKENIAELIKVGIAVNKIENK